MGPTRTTKLALPLLLILLVLSLSSFSQISCQIISSTYSRSGRNLIEAENVLKQSDDTVRVDPLNKLKKYRGGYDVTNLHYWSSTAYTGISGFALGVIWLLCGLGYGIFLLANSLCCTNRKNNGQVKENKKRKSPCHKQCYLLPALLAVFFTILSITATGLVLGGNAEFHSRAKKVVNIIIDTANNASETIYNTTRAMKTIDNNLEESTSSQASIFLRSTSQRLDSQASDLQTQVINKRETIHLCLKILYIVVTSIISLNLVALIALSVAGVLKLRRGLHMLIILCWLLTALCLLFFGVYFFLEKFEGDTCKALEEFRQDPYNNSLSSILPCDQLLLAKPILDNFSQGVYNIISEANERITRMQANAYIEICNPFSAPPEYNYQPQNCPTNSILIGDIPKALKLVTCVEEASTGTCNGGIYMSTRNFNRVKAYTSSIQTLIDAYPGIQSLVDCQMVSDAFSVILSEHCKPLRRYTRMVWAPLVLLSTLMMALVLLWTVGSHHERGYHSFDTSVKPHYGTEIVMEIGNVKVINNEKETELSVLNV